MCGGHDSPSATLRYGAPTPFLRALRVPAPHRSWPLLRCAACAPAGSPCRLRCRRGGGGGRSGIGGSARRAAAAGGANRCVGWDLLRSRGEEGGRGAAAADAPSVRSMRSFISSFCGSSIAVRAQKKRSFVRAIAVRLEATGRRVQRRQSRLLRRWQLQHPPTFFLSASSSSCRALNACRHSSIVSSSLGACSPLSLAGCCCCCCCWAAVAAASAALASARSSTPPAWFWSRLLDENPILPELQEEAAARKAVT